MCAKRRKAIYTNSYICGKGKSEPVLVSRLLFPSYFWLLTTGGRGEGRIGSFETKLENVLWGLEEEEEERVKCTLIPVLSRDWWFQLQQVNLLWNKRLNIVRGMPFSVLTPECCYETQNCFTTAKLWSLEITPFSYLWSLEATFLNASNSCLLLHTIVTPLKKKEAVGFK